MSENTNEKIADVKIQYDPEVQEFDHSKAYADGGIMKEKIEAVITLAREHGAPLILAAAVNNMPDQDATMLLSMNEREGLGLPSNMQMAISVMKMDRNELELIYQIINLMESAKINVTQVQDNIKAATANVVDMLKHEGRDEDGQPLLDKAGNPLSVN